MVFEKDAQWLLSYKEETKKLNYSHQADMIQVYSGGSQIQYNFGPGIFSELLNWNIFIRLPDYCSFVQAKLIMAIYIAAKNIQYGGISGRDIHIMTESKAGIRYLENAFITWRMAEIFNGHPSMGPWTHGQTWQLYSWLVGACTNHEP